MCLYFKTERNHILTNILFIIFTLVKLLLCGFSYALKAAPSILYYECIHHMNTLYLHGLLLCGLKNRPNDEPNYTLALLAA